MEEGLEHINTAIGQIMHLEQTLNRRIFSTEDDIAIIERPPLKREMNIACDQLSL